jgi:hypothetical protein
MDSVKLTPPKGYWVCVHRTGITLGSSIALSKKDSIRKILEGSTMTWQHAQSNGWMCIKVDITFSIAE